MVRLIVYLLTASCLFGCAHLGTPTTAETRTATQHALGQLNVSTEGWHERGHSIILVRCASVEFYGAVQGAARLADRTIIEAYRAMPCWPVSETTRFGWSTPKQTPVVCAEVFVLPRYDEQKRMERPKLPMQKW